MGTMLREIGGSRLDLMVEDGQEEDWEDVDSEEEIKPLQRKSIEKMNKREGKEMKQQKSSQIEKIA